jgi:hypothetical protein
MDFKDIIKKDRQKEAGRIFFLSYSSVGTTFLVRVELLNEFPPLLS